MKAKFAAFVLAALFIAAAPAIADTVSFGGSNVKLGTTNNYTLAGQTVTAYGYVCSAASATSASLSNCSSSDLFAKNGGSGEFGLGLAGETNNEFGWDGSSSDYILGLDVSNLFSAGVTSLTFSFQSVQSSPFPEGYAIFGFGSNPFGTSATLSNNVGGFTNTSGSGDTFSTTVSLNANDQFLVFTAPSGNALLSTATTPEPGTLVLLGTGLLMLGFGMRRRWVSYSA